ncbi:MAG: pantetheine-phosphate adenylyltransferase [Proteobacteria bacterium]|nr:pantetheine-phosphate adenylyltransferase [Pseudomonadota bacterium]
MRIGVYPGTFDPITFGHLDIVRRGLRLVDKLVIGVTTNPAKAPLFSADERIAQIKRETRDLAKISGTGIEVAAFETLLMDFAASQGASIVMRGLRAVSDFEYEFQMAGMNTALNSQIETVFLMADARLQPIASRLVREIAAFGGDISKFVPKAIAEEVKAKMKG